jgi:hypothetical protein
VYWDSSTVKDVRSDFQQFCDTTWWIPEDDSETRKQMDDLHEDVAKLLELFNYYVEHDAYTVN